VIARLAPLAVVLLLAGCQKEEPPAPAPPPEPTPAATPAPAPSATVADEGPTPPTEEDFEEEAAKEVTAANLDAQLDALEKEINAE
jgi:hypothetical protein